MCTVILINLTPSLTVLAVVKYPVISVQQYSRKYFSLWRAVIPTSCLRKNFTTVFANTYLWQKCLIYATGWLVGTDIFHSFITQAVRIFETSSFTHFLTDMFPFWYKALKLSKKSFHQNWHIFWNVVNVK